MTTAEILRQLQRVPDKADFAPYETACLPPASNATPSRPN